jgi:hypothetical protein
MNHDAAESAMSNPIYDQLVREWTNQTRSAASPTPPSTRTPPAAAEPKLTVTKARRTDDASPPAEKPASADKSAADQPVKPAKRTASAASSASTSSGAPVARTAS